MLNEFYSSNNTYLYYTQVNGRRIPAHIDDLELLGDLGNGTCGHVVKMRHKPSQQVGK